MLLYLEAALLLAGTIVLAGPASTLLARARWVVRAPRAALVLWQAIGLAGGLGIVTAGVTLAVADLEQHWLAGALAVPRRWRQMGFWGWLGNAISLAVGVYLISATILSTARVLAARRAHRRRLALISELIEVADDRPGDAPVHLVDHPHAVAYGVPGLRPRVVLTKGTLEALTPAELQAVLAHEQAHARGRHDLVIQPFIAWARTLRFLPGPRAALESVAMLVEMLADDAAVRRYGAAQLASALGKLSGQHLDVGGRDTETWRQELAARQARLMPGAAATMPAFAAAAVYVLAVAIVVVPPVALAMT